MDKDMERLGKERLGRVKRRKRIAVIVSVLAVVVLGFTGYRLIQPASAADQNQAEFTIDNETIVYTNLAKLNVKPKMTVADGSKVEWNGKTFNVSANLDFEITKDEAATAGNNYYFVYSSGNILISDKLCQKWYEHQDERGNHAFDYHFVKNADGTYAVVVKFVEGYIDSDIKAGINFSCEAKGNMTDGGDIIVDVGGDVILEVDNELIEWNKDNSLNYDISIEKSTTTENTIQVDSNGKLFVEYKLDISSTKGTPDVIQLNDVLYLAGLKVDTSNVNVSVKKNGNSLNAYEYSYSVAADDNYCTLTGTFPKLNANEKLEIKYKYYVNTDKIADGVTVSCGNKASVVSQGKNNEKVVDEATCCITYSKNAIYKEGRYENGYIEWTIKVNQSRDDIAGYRLTDTNLANTSEVNITSEQDTDGKGYKINKSGSEVTSIDFIGINGTSNTSTYVIKYKVKAEQCFDRYEAHNKVELVKGDNHYEYDASVSVPGAGEVSKTALGANNDTSNKIYTIQWKSVIKVPEGGIKKGLVIKDEVSADTGNPDNHYMTYEQVQEYLYAAADVFGYYDIIDFKVITLDGQVVSFWNVNSGSYKGYKGVMFTVNKDIAYNSENKEANNLTIKYHSTGDYSNGVNAIYYNDFWAGERNAHAEYSKSLNVKKTDGQGRRGTTYVNVNDDGTLTWKVFVTLADDDASVYTITDNLPSGVSVDKVQISMLYDNQDRYTYASLDGTEYSLSDKDGYFMNGIKTSSKKTTTDGKDKVVTTVKKGSNTTAWYPDSKIILTYSCKINDYDTFDQGTVFTFTNKVKASSDKESNCGEDEQTQIATKPKKNQSGENEEEKGNGILNKQYTWNNTDHILNYTVTINPEGKDLVDNCETLTLTDELTYKIRTWTNADVSWQVHVVPGSVKLYYATLQDNGTYKIGDKVDDWSWKYEEAPMYYSNSTYYDSIKNLITASVPDGQTLIMKYSYAVTTSDYTLYNEDCPVPLDITNKVSLVGVSGSETEKHASDSLTNEETSAYIYKNSQYIFYKVDKDNYSKLLEGAEFTLYKYDSSSGKYNEFKKYVTDKEGKFVVEYKNGEFDYNTQYYVQETKAPKGYVLPNDPQKYYLYFGASNTSKYPVCAENGQLAGRDLAETYYIEMVENEAIPTTSINVEKFWKDSDGTTQDKSEGSIFLQVYQVDQNGKSTAYGNVIEVKPDKNGKWFYSISGLPKTATDDMGNLLDFTYKYYVEEVGVDEKYNMAGYSTSYVYINENGVASGEIGDSVTSSQAISSGTVQITNKSISYKLPETGGSGNRWMFLLGGTILTLFALVSLIYKRHII